MITHRLGKSRLWLGALSIIVTGFAFGQGAGDISKAGAGATLSEADRAFVCEAAVANILEVKMSRIAALRADSNPLRGYAQEMAQDYSRANRKLKEIAWSKDLEMCEELDYKRAQRLLALQRHVGDEFDREYLTLQVDQRRRMVRLFQQQAQTGGDEELREFAESRLPALEAYLNTARTLADNR